MLGRVRKLYPFAIVAIALTGSVALGTGPLSLQGSDAAARPSKRPPRVVPATVLASERFDIDTAIAVHDQAERDRIEAERIAAERAAAEAAKYAGIFPSVEHWLRIHACEQGDSWTAYGRFGNGMMGGGGLGISDAAWIAWGGLQYAPTAAGADPLDQMRVASVGYARYGASPWGCR